MDLWLNLDRCRVAVFTNEGAGTVAGGDPPLGAELGDGLADDGPGHPKAFGEFGLGGEPGAGWESAVKDLTTEPVGELPVEGEPANPVEPVAAAVVGHHGHLSASWSWSCYDQSAGIVTPGA
jgi:hypothetical protein